MFRIKAVDAIIAISAKPRTGARESARVFSRPTHNRRPRIVERIASRKRERRNMDYF
jgi:hypothetical protein